MIFHYWFLNYWFKFEDFVWTGSHYLTLLCLNIDDIAVINIKDVDNLLAVVLFITTLDQNVSIIFLWII